MLPVGSDAHLDKDNAAASGSLLSPQRPPATSMQDSDFLRSSPPKSTFVTLSPTKPTPVHGQSTTSGPPMASMNLPRSQTVPGATLDEKYGRDRYERVHRGQPNRTFDNSPSRRPPLRPNTDRERQPRRSANARVQTYEEDDNFAAAAGCCGCTEGWLGWLACGCGIGACC